MSNLLGLAAYEDSDEDDISPLHKRRKSTSLVDGEDRGPAPIADTRLTENPEAPSSRDASPEAEQPPPRPHESDEDEKEFEPTTWISPEPGETPSAEPPPPPRPPSRPLFSTPTPPTAPPSSSRSQSPSSSRMNSTRNRREETLPATQSSLSLVSYSAEDEEDAPIAAGLLELKKEVLEEDKEPEKMEQEPEMEEEETEQKKIFSQEEMDILDSVIDTKLEAAGSEGSASPALSVQEVQIPPAPTKSCPQLLLDQFKIHFEKKERGMDFNMSIQRRKDFRNPSIYEKLIEHVGIDEIGSNFDRKVFDPHAFKPSDFYDKLAERQKIAMDRLEKEKKSGDKKDTPLEKSRKSKWDVPGSKK